MHFHGLFPHIPQADATAGGPAGALAAARAFLEGELGELVPGRVNEDEPRPTRVREGGGGLITSFANQ